MAREITADQVVTTARELDQDEFTRADLAGKLSVERSELKQGFKAARKSGRVEKIRNDDDGTGLFRLTE
jgi:DNA-binding transcriptional regulator LsrR (DeoR family)